MRGKTVFVAGHAGMVGSGLVRRLEREKVELLSMGRSQVIFAIRQTSINLDVRRIQALGWHSTTPITDALRFAYRAFLALTA